MSLVLFGMGRIVIHEICHDGIIETINLCNFGGIEYECNGFYYSIYHFNAGISAFPGCKPTGLSRGEGWQGVKNLCQKAYCVLQC